MAIILPMKNKPDYTVCPSKIICLGLNYLEHIKELGSVNVQNFSNEIPDEPILFAKTPNVLIGGEEPIILPTLLAGYGFADCRTDYEGELAIIIKDRVKDVAKDKALSHVLGFTCFNDVSQRNFQREDKSGWFRGKSLDTFGPIGPVIVTPEDIGNPQNLSIQTRLNKRIVQNSNTRKMIFPILEIISFVSRNFTLEPGDIISTGTPAGVGPLQPGDVVEVKIEGIGTLRNQVTGFSSQIQGSR